jgi:rubrerythrin
MTTQELSRKWKQKKIANLAYIADECDHIKASERILLYRLIEAIFDEFEADLKLLAATAVVKSVCPNCGELVKPVILGSMCPSCACDM